MNFVILKPEKIYEVFQHFTFKTYYAGKFYNVEVLGHIVGNINDRNFVKKLNYWRAKLNLAGIVYSQSVAVITNKEVRTLNDYERYSRKMSRVFNEFWRQIDKCGGLFRQDDIDKVCEKYIATVGVLKKRYNQK
jgi:hypothetical protein